MTARVLVTGATGFLGRALTRRLRAEGVSVHATSRRGGRVEGIEVEPVDLTRSDAAEALRRTPVEAVFHLAAEIPELFASPGAEASFRANIAMTHQILEAVEVWGCHLIYASSTSVYGPRPPAPCPETTPPQCDNFYSSGKYAGEVLCEHFAVRRGLPLTILRISAPYGPGNPRATVITRFLGHAMRSEDLTLWGSGRRQQDFTYLDDVVSGFWLAYRRRAVGAFNIASGRSIAMSDLAALVLAVVPESRSQVVSAGVPDPQEEYRPQFSIERAREALGWQPQVSLRDGLDRCAEGLRQATAAGVAR